MVFVSLMEKSIIAQSCHWLIRTLYRSDAPTRHRCNPDFDGSASWMKKMSAL